MFFKRNFVVIAFASLLSIGTSASETQSPSIPHSSASQITQLNTLSSAMQLPDRLSSNLVIEGDFLLDKSIQLEGFELLIKGNLIHSAGVLNVGAGRLLVEGDYRVQQIVSAETATFGASDGRLQMTEPNGQVLIKGAFVMQSNHSHLSLLREGLLEVQGHFSQLLTANVSSPLNFVGSRNHKVLLSGTNQQVSFASDRSGFQTLELADGSATGLQFLTSITISNNFFTNGQPLPAISGTLNWSLQQDQIINGDVKLLGGTFNVNGKKLSIEGNLLHEAGILYVNAGQVVIDEDYLLQKLPINSDLPPGASDGRLDMRSASDYLLVKGNFVMQSDRSHLSTLSAGVIEIKGDFTQRRTANISSNSNFSPTRTHKVLLSGTDQKVFFESANSNFQDLELALDTAAGVEFLSPITINGNLINFGQPLNAIELKTLNWILEQDQVINGDFRLLGGRINLAGRSLTVHGNVLQEDGTIFINNGRFIVDGDYRIQQAPLVEGAAYRASDGRLQMTQDADYVLIKGDFVTQSNQSHLSLLQNGLLEVQGHFSQLRTANSNSRFNFSASRSHQVMLSGRAEQVVTFEAADSGFQTLKQANFAGISLVGDIRITQPQQYFVQLNVQSEAGSRVISTDGLFNCVDSCGVFYEAGQVVMLRPEAFMRDIFTKWPRDCFVDRAGNCIFTVNQVRNLTFEFEALPVKLRRRSATLKLLLLIPQPDTLQ